MSRPVVIAVEMSIICCSNGMIKIICGNGLVDLPILFYFFSIFIILFIYHIYYNEVRLVVQHSLEVWIVWDPFPLEKGSEMFYLTTHSTHFFYGYMASDIWLRTILIVRKETRCRHICYSY